MAVDGVMAQAGQDGDDLMLDRYFERYPATVAVFLRHRMLCVGCPIAPFHTIDDACAEHGVDPGEFRRALRAAIAAPGSGLGD